MPPHMAMTVKQLMHWYERYLAPVAFFAGFMLDAFTLTRVDVAWENIILVGHLCIAAAGILLINALEANRLPAWISERFAPLFPLMVQFSFGALFSGFTVLYFRSGSLTASWLFLLILAAFLIGNEFLRERYRHLAFHGSIYFLVLFAYLIFAVAVAMREVGPRPFLVAGLGALGLIALLMTALWRIAPARFHENRAKFFAGVASVYAAFNILYFTNEIPPIPLSLKHAGIYHSAAYEGAALRTTYEAPPWYRFWQETNSTFNWQPGEPVYAVSAVFAPAAIQADIVHHWLFYDASAGDWVERGRYSYAIVGGRSDGYRGFSFKQAIEPGRWRVDIRTGRGELLGRVRFTIVTAGGAIPLSAREL